ncbi:1-acyl-sn-glycerol-3-phosphate acyltransferase [Gulosibacter molinativorax]|uniref:1-acyl-sn-glycerol-3-phosphate acyltransferase n=2 Tax=Gulosibacter molinativorax TaxID=256821 RepID=A0ABT7C8H0_9MICO|nr:1-acyl-sn-glycerol-3-phosphate acyltransferase [Gulosibacter molinativorax]QUY62458.1 1-acyl-sn-glycerol-3-phosphate acyltransferase [Gulosibacter molinativorax]
MAGIAVPPLKLLFKYDVKGTLPATGPYILTPNHYSDIDPVVTGYGVWRLGRKPRFMAKASLFKIPVVGWLLHKSGQIPVERSRSRAKANSMNAANQIIELGGAVIVYPEGTLTREPDMWPMRGKTGAARLALQSGIPVIPIATWGAQAVVPRFQKKFKFRFRAPIKMIVGKPIDLSEFEGKHSSKRAIDGATDKIMREITALVEEIRGAKAPKELYDPAAHGQTEYGMPNEIKP